MKKILSFLLSLLAFAPSQAQLVRQGSPAGWIQLVGGIMIDSALNIPVRDTLIFVPVAGTRMIGRVTLRPQDGLTYVYNGIRWNAIGSGGSIDSSIYATRFYVSSRGFLTSASSLNASNLFSGTIPAARYGSGTIDVSKINASGTPSSTTYLRGDATWATVSAGGAVIGANGIYASGDTLLNGGTSPIGSLLGTDVYFYGTSIEAGVGASVSSKRWTTQFCNITGAVEHDFGISGSTLCRCPPYVVGSDNFIDNLSTVPTHTASMKLAVIGYLLNDVGGNTACLTPQKAQLTYDTVITNFIGKGWSPSQILILAPDWIGTAGYAVYAAATGNPAPTVARHLSFVLVAQNSAAKWGTMYFDWYHSERQNDTTLLGDNIHPNDSGHLAKAKAVSHFLGLPYSLATSSGFVCSSCDSIYTTVVGSGSAIVYTTAPSLTNTGGVWESPSGGTSFGNLGLASTTFLGDNYVFIRGDTHQGFLGLNSTNASAGYNSMSVGFEVGSGGVYVTDAGAGGLNLTPMQTGITIADSVRINRTGSTFTCDVTNGSGGWTTKYTYVFASSGTMYHVTDINNSVGAKLVFPRCSCGGSSTTTAALKFIANDTASQPAKFNITGNGFIGSKLGVGTTMPNASAKADITSTTQGFLMPRMTTTQMNAISSPPEGLMIYNNTAHTLYIYNGSAWTAH